MTRAAYRAAAGGFCAAAAAFVHLLGGCGADPSADTAPYVAPNAEIGFLDLGEEQYSLGSTPLTSSRARIFYDFQPAETATQQTPLFVLGGGGPGASAMFLLGYLGPNTIVETDAAGASWAPNASRLTDLGHLLYLDARNAGFSYPVIADPADRSKRQADLGAQNYNVYRDAADEWRALLAFWELHPELAHNPVYFLAESYGGMRATVMLNMLFFQADYASGGRAFSAPDLMQRLPRPEQFRGQILLEPLFAGMRQEDVAATLFEQPGSVLDQLAAETGVPYLRCASGCTAFGNAQLYLMTIDRSLYDYRASYSWLDRIIETLSDAATHREVLARLTGVETAAEDRVLGGSRTGAYRFGDPNNALFCPRGDLEQTYGALQPWDAHFVAFNVEAMGAFTGSASKALLADTSQAGFGDLFIENLRHVPTFVSRATYDLTIYGPAIVPVLQSYPEVRRAALDATGREIQVELTDGTVRSIFSPEYASSHLVQHDRPAELHADIAAFLARTGQ
jgi:pimeloyl-ACP methyl ester carboxylesterase